MLRRDPFGGYYQQNASHPYAIFLLCRNLWSWYGTDCETGVAHQVHDRQIQNGFVTTQPAVGNQGTENGKQIGDTGEGVEHLRGRVIAVVEVAREVQYKNS